MPAHNSFFGISFVTKEYVATIEFSPIVTFGIIVLCVAILQFRSKIILPFLLSIVECENLKHLD